jgi:AcrR family transcriptional regulator
LEPSLTEPVKKFMLDTNEVDSPEKPVHQLVNQIGQTIGTKGLRTRQRLVDVTVDLLETRGLRDVTVAEIARVAATSPATFYVYFDGVPEVVLAALEQTTQSAPDLLSMLEADWADTDEMDRAREFVERYCTYWWGYRIIFRCRNLAAEEGDARFVAARRMAAAPTMEALAESIDAAQRADKIPTHLKPRASAGAILTLIEQLAAVGPTTPAQPGINFDTLKDSAAFMIAGMMGWR